MVALKASPPESDAGFIYEEYINHPAFGTQVTNKGVFVVTEDSTLIRRQIAPKLEELEFGEDEMVIRRDGKAAKRPIPKKLAPLLSTLRAIILGQPERIESYYPSDLKVHSEGWSVVLTTVASRKETLELSGCGNILQELRLTTARGQDRSIRFIAP